MERRFTFVIFVRGYEWAAICDQHINTAAEMRAMKFGIWAAASKFKQTASVYVYQYNKIDCCWHAVDSMNGKDGDDFAESMSDGYVKLLASAKCGKVKI